MTEIGTTFEPLEWEAFVQYFQEKGVTNLDVVHAGSHERTDMVLHDVSRNFYWKVLMPQLKEVSEEWDIRIQCQLHEVFHAGRKAPYVDVHVVFFWKKPGGAVQTLR